MSKICAVKSSAVEYCVDYVHKKRLPPHFKL